MRLGVGALLLVVDGSALWLLDLDGLYVCVVTGVLAGYAFVVLEPVRHLVYCAECGRVNHVPVDNPRDHECLETTEAPTSTR